jgi:hypothetical protein
VHQAYAQAYDKQASDRLLPQKPAPRTADKGYWDRFLECMNDYRFDNLIRDIGTSAGHPSVGEFAADLSITGTVVSLINFGLNATKLGSKPRGGLGGVGKATHAGDPTTWQHTVGGAIGQRTGMPVIGRVARMVGRVAKVGSGALLAFEGGYEAGNAIACAAIARQ